MYFLILPFSPPPPPPQWSIDTSYDVMGGQLGLPSIKKLPEGKFLVSGLTIRSHQSQQGLHQNVKKFKSLSKIKNAKAVPNQAAPRLPCLKALARNTRNYKKTYMNITSKHMLSSTFLFSAYSPPPPPKYNGL